MKNKSAILPIASIALLTAAAYFLLYLDAIVNTTLYHFGLQYSPMWAVPYWTVLNVILALVLVSALTMLATLFFQRKTPKSEELQIKEQKEHIANVESEVSALLETPKPKKYKYTLYFTDLYRAKNFEKLLHEQLPSIEIAYYPSDIYTKMVFVVDEKIEDLDEFQEIIKHEVEEVK